MWRTRTALATILCLVALLGCDKGGGKGSRPKGSGGGTGREARGPKETLAALWRAMARGDGNAAARFYDVSVDEEDFIIAAVPLILNIQAFCKAGKRTYGEARWTAMVGNSRVEFLNKPPVPDADTMADKITWKIEGDRATCHIGGMPPTWRLVRKYDVWCVLPDNLPPKEARDRIRKNIAGAAQMIDEATAKMGQPGVMPGQVFDKFLEGMERIVVMKEKPGLGFEDKPAPPE